MKKFMWVALALAVAAIPSYAQQTPAGDVSAGHSYFRLGGLGSSGVNLNGFNASAAYNANDWFGVVGDLGVYHGSPSGVGVTTTTYTFGPRFSYRQGSSQVVPYAQALFGGSHLSVSGGGSSNPFAFSFGGGADIGIGTSGKVSLRPEVDYFGLHANGVTGNCVRISVGIVFHIGER
jgi:hypothetical protein